MTQRRDLTLPTLLLASLTAYGFLLVWAQNDTIELTTPIGGHGNPISPAGFNIVTGKNVSIELAPWHSTSTVPAVTTPVHYTTGNPGVIPTAATSAATIPPPTAAKNRSGLSSGTAATTGGASSQHTANVHSIPRSIKRSRAATNSTGRISIKVKIQSSAPQGEAMAIFLQKVCTLFQTLQLEDVIVTLGPERTPMLCSTSVIN